MNKKWIFLWIAACLLVSGQDLANAEKLSLHASCGFSSPTSDSIKSGFETGFGFALAVNKKIAVSFNFGFWKSNVNEKPGQLMEGSLTVTPFLATIQYSFLGNKKFIPYLLVGAGYVFSDFKIKNLITIPEVRISQKIDNGPALQAGLGSQLLMLRRLSFFAEALYIYRKAEATTTISDLNFGLSEEKFTLNMSTFFVSLGIKYYL